MRKDYLNKIAFLEYIDKESIHRREIHKVIRLARDKEVMVRVMTATVLGNWNKKEAFRTLIYLTNDKENIVRMEAYDSLHLFTSINTLQFLFDKILEENDDLTCSYAIRTWVDIILDLNIRFEQLDSNIHLIKSIKRGIYCTMEMHRYDILTGHYTDFDDIAHLLLSSDYKEQCYILNILIELFELHILVHNSALENALSILLRSDLCIASREYAEKLYDIINMG